MVNQGTREARPEPSGAACHIPEWRAAFGVLPAAAAMLNTNNPIGCVLVVDPKRETGLELDWLGASVRTFAPKAGAGSPALDLMRGPEWSLDADLKEGRGVAVARRSGKARNLKGTPGRGAA